MRIVLAILWGGLAAGLMDFFAAMTMNRLPALTIGRGDLDQLIEAVVCVVGAVASS